MSSQQNGPRFGSLAFSVDLCFQNAKTKENALEQLLDYFAASQPQFTANLKDAVAEFIDEADGLITNSTEEIIRAELPAAQVADLERLGFRLYPVPAA